MNFVLRIIIFCFVAALVSLPARAGVGIEELGAPEGFHWRESHESESNTLILELWSDENEKTKVKYLFDTLSGDLISSVNKDLEYQVAAVRPGEEILQAHPEFLESVEDSYMEILGELGLEVPEKSFLKRKDEGGFSYLPTSERFNLRLKVARDLSVLIAEVTGKIKKTEDWYGSFLGETTLKGIQSIFAGKNVVEPIRTKIASNETRLDAFALYPLLVLKNHGEAMLEAMEGLSYQPDRYVLDWLLYETDVPQTVRKAIIMLLTHNHTSETYFIKGVVSKLGVKRGWDALSFLNTLYKNERDYWEKPSRRRLNSGLSRFYGRAGWGKSHWEVNISPRLRLKSLSFDHSVPLAVRSERNEWIPYPQRYHYYGAFLISMRIQDEFNLSDTMLAKAVGLLGYAYKRSTKGKNLAQLKLMDKYYRMGANHFIQLRDLK